MEPAAEIKKVLHLVADEAVGAALEQRGAPGEVLDGEPIESIAVLYDSGPVRAGIWGCTPGSWRTDYSKLEQFSLLRGKVTLRSDAGEEVELGEESTCLIPAGWTGTWTVHEEVRKIWVTTAHERSN